LNKRDHQARKAMEQGEEVHDEANSAQELADESKSLDDKFEDLFKNSSDEDIDNEELAGFNLMRITTFFGTAIQSSGRLVRSSLHNLPSDINILPYWKIQID
jgi:hypothetical protein